MISAFLLRPVQSIVDEVQRFQSEHLPSQQYHTLGLQVRTSYMPAAEIRVLLVHLCFEWAQAQAFLGLSQACVCLREGLDETADSTQ